MIEYPHFTFMNDKAGTTSAIAIENLIRQKCNEDLKEFLAPKLSKVDAIRTRKHDSKLKTCAQALGRSTPRTKPIETVQEKKMEESAKLKSINNELSLEIKSLKTQLSLMKN